MISKIHSCCCFFSLALIGSIAIADEANNLCLGEYCFEPTLDLFLANLSAETDYKISGLGSSKFLELNEPTTINEQMFKVKYSEMSIKKSEYHMLSFDYEFTPRTSLTCEKRFKKLLKTLNSTHGPFEAGIRPKKAKGYSSKIVREQNSIPFRMHSNKDGSYKNNVSEVVLTSGVTIRIQSTSMDSDSTKAFWSYPTCKYSITFIKED